MLILLSNGHGINTLGKRSNIWEDGSQLFEWEFNRDIVRRIKSKLDKLGIESIIIVPEIEDISLAERCRRVNDIYNKRKDAILISIHANAGGGTGWEAWTSVGKTKSDDYAEILYQEAEKSFKDWKIRKDLSDGDSDKEEQFYILKNTKCPAVLTENFFMDTAKDCKFLMTESGREQIANMHVNAIKRFYEVK